MKLIIGVKGTGKTKTLISMVNETTEKSQGSVICVEYGTALNYDIKYKTRLIDITTYNINSTVALYGFVAGMLASNHDITDIFVDSLLKICADKENLEKLILDIDALASKANVNCTFTVSMPEEEIPESLKKFC